ncbi:MAG: hypothetical protein B7X04_00925 [Parcubacteria group bacterium 21-54-25]|nr:MAG: hypothetical protein B7X04_00925 [Parcubacteria group bacterium 21-54-25]HQU07794.1 glutamate--tRNA ligase family protein [Candidatus Paceibacterota bacterium]
MTTIAYTKTRFAPSPTGLLHSGNYRTAVFSYLFARQHGGQFVLRIEDTDRARSRKEYEDNIVESLAWLGLEYDDFSRQSEHVGAHRAAIQKLVDSGAAYVSQETPKTPDARAEVIRFKNPGGVISFADVVRGAVSMDVSDLGDFVIAKGFDEPIFHLAVVVDDADAGITHVIRGEDHISNTPRQILIQRALGLETPVYAHLPLILAADRSKLSKRKGAKALTEYREMGVLSEAMLNYLALLGWHPEDDCEYLSRADLMARFSLDRVQKSGAMFDETKLFSVNQHWMRALSDAAYGTYLGRGEAIPPALLQLCKDKAHTFKEAQDLLTKLNVELYGALLPDLNEGTLRVKEPSDQPSATRKHLTHLLLLIERLPDDVGAATIKDVLMPYADQEGRAAVLWPLRYALSHAERSPDPFTLIAILGKNEALNRIHKALAILKE